MDEIAGPQTPAKPGAACLGCRHRKLKCSRGSPCNNCSKSDLPCIYTAQDGHIKRKRGPYKKDKSARERHLEEVVRYLGGTVETTTEGAKDVAVAAENVKTSPKSTPEFRGKEQESSDDLVRDALNALTRSTFPDEDPISETVTAWRHLGLDRHEDADRSLVYGLPQLMKCLHLYGTRFDPMTKIIHWPTFMSMVCDNLDSLGAFDQGRRGLLHAVCFAAVSTCTQAEARNMFFASKQQLLQEYSRSVEAILAQAAEQPQMEALQALLIYMTALVRSSHDWSMRMLFTLGVRMAQLMGLQNDPGSNFPPFEAEMRRRLWWTLCGLESRSAEEGAMKNHSIMQGMTVRFPVNFNDIDLNDHLVELPKERPGWSDILICKCRWETIYTTFRIWTLRDNRTPHMDKDTDVKVEAQQQRILDDLKDRLEKNYFQYMSSTRPKDWVLLTALENMTLKAQIVIDHPHGILKACMSKPGKRIRHLQRSVTIIERTHALHTDPRAAPWHWYFRNYTQWHALAVVITDLSQSPDREFSKAAWAVLDPVLANWDRLYEIRKGEPAWDHVNTLVLEAQARRQRQMVLDGATAQSVRGSEFAMSMQQASGTQAGTIEWKGPAASAELGLNGITPFDLNMSDEYLLPGSTGANETLGTAAQAQAQASIAVGGDVQSVASEPTVSDSSVEGIDPFAGFDPQAFEKVFGDIDWDQIDPMGMMNVS